MRSRMYRQLSVIAVCALAAACTSPAPPVAPPEPSRSVNAPLPVRSTERHQVTLGEGLVLDYQIEQKLSRVNAKACFAYITGVLYNRSKESISKKSGLDVIVTSQGRQLFRDQTYPVADLPPGMGAAIEMVISPVHNDGCPRYDKVSITLRRVPL